jgi:hypothetical protein
MSENKEQKIDTNSRSHWFICQLLNLTLFVETGPFIHLHTKLHSMDRLEYIAMLNINVQRQFLCPLS